MDDIILYFCLKYEGNFSRIFQAIENRENFNREELTKWKFELDCDYVPITSPLYPECFKTCHRPPFVIFYRGDISLIKENKLGVIGSRFATKYGKSMCQKIIPTLARNNICIVSGLAKGIDSIAHQSAIDSLGKTIAVLGCGLNHYYPAENKNLQLEIEKTGLVMSEFPPNVGPTKDKFVTRNRLIASLGMALLVIEAKLNSGTMITVNDSLDLGKDIMCVPNEAGKESGCNELIKAGAYLVENGNEVLNILGIRNKIN